MNKSPICRYIYQWIDDLRNDLYVAVRIDRFLQLANGYLEEVGVDDIDGELESVSESDLKECIKYDSTVKIVKARDGTEVLILWGDWRLYDLVNKIIEVAAKEGETAVSVP
jgi:hypothetical protein